MMARYLDALRLVCGVSKKGDPSSKCQGTLQIQVCVCLFERSIMYAMSLIVSSDLNASHEVAFLMTCSLKDAVQ